jgi:TRAP-type C4-dicarboxylate transport system permease small subunit
VSIITALIYIVAALLIIGVLFWAVQQLLPLIPLPEPFRRIIYVLLVVILVLIAVYVILQLLGVVTGGLHIGRISSSGTPAVVTVLLPLHWFV